MACYGVQKSGNQQRSFQGISATQTVNGFNNNDDVRDRSVVRKSWNGQYATGSVNGYRNVTTPFRAVNNLGDFLGRQYYTCGGSNQTDLRRPGRATLIGSIISNCDGTGVPASVTNVKFVPDSSDYTTYRRQRAVNINYNDLSFGGDQSNASYQSWMHVHRF
jgi:hypothetical protein